MTSPLENHVALVTGGASGIGRATALALSECGANIAVVDRDTDGLSRVASEVERSGRTAKGFTVDLADASSLPPLVRNVVEGFGRIDILVNCAGISGVTGQLQNTVDFTDDAFETVMNINLRAAFVLTARSGGT